MAGDWIPKRKGLSRHRKVLAMATALGLSRRETVGTLLDVWDWVDEETADGSLPGMTIKMIAEAVAVSEEFLLAMVQVDWLTVAESGIIIPNFDKWLGQSAKKRLENTERQRLSRARRDASATTGQYRTEEKEESPLTPLRGEGGKEEFPAPSATDFVSAWNAVPGFITCRDLNEARQRQLRARCKNTTWRRDWREALDRASRIPFCLGRGEKGWIATIDWFLRPGSVGKVMEGTYDRLECKGGPAKPRESPEAKSARLVAEREQGAEDARKAAEGRARVRQIGGMPRR